MAKESTIFYNNKKCNCKIRCRAGNLNSAGATTRRPPEEGDDDIPTTDICDMHTITARTALRSENNHHIQNNNDPEKTNYQQHQRRQQQQYPHNSHNHQKQHRKSQHQHRHSRHHHPRHHHYIVLQNHVIIIIILLLFIKILFVNCQHPTQIDQEQQQQQQPHHHHHHPPHSSKKELTAQSVCSGSCSQDKATAAEIQLKYMQQHILARLKFTKLPNMSHVPHVPENIIADFMRSTQQHQLKDSSKKYHRKSTFAVRKNGGYYGQQNRHQKRSHSNGFSDMDDYQGDAPASDNEMKTSKYYDTMYGDSEFGDYQGDAPASDDDNMEEDFEQFDDEDDDDDDDEFDDDDEPFYSVVDKVYIIPTVTTISKYTH